jgi:hypothetical protein
VCVSTLSTVTEIWAALPTPIDSTTFQSLNWSGPTLTLFRNAFPLTGVISSKVTVTETVTNIIQYNNARPSLSSGTIAGIALGSSLGALILAGLCFFAYLARRRSRRYQQAVLLKAKPVAAIMTKNDDVYTSAQELDASRHNHLAELASTVSRIELPDRSWS